MNVGADRAVYEVLAGGGISGPIPKIEWVNVPARKREPVGRYHGLHGRYPHPLGLFEGWHTGFPPEMPDPVFEVRLGRAKPLADLEPEGLCWLVSGRARHLLEALDRDAFDFRAATVRILKRGKVVETPEYHVCDCVRWLDALDESKSCISVDEHSWGGRFVGLSFAVVRRDRLGAAKFFRLMHTPFKVFCTEEVRAATTAASLAGFKMRQRGLIDG